MRHRALSRPRLSVSNRSSEPGPRARSESDRPSSAWHDARVNDYTWTSDLQQVDLDELSNLYRIAPLGDKPPHALATVFGNSMYRYFVFADDVLVGAGRCLADGLDCAYVADVAVHPDHQARGLGKAIIQRLASSAEHHKKIILYANPGTEGFYRQL